MRRTSRRKHNYNRRPARIKSGYLHPSCMKCPFTLDDKLYLSLEHYIQSVKFGDNDWAECVRLSKTIQEVNRLGNFILAEPDPLWSREYRKRIKRGMEASLSQNPILQQVLTNTQSETLSVRYSSNIKFEDKDRSIPLQHNLIGELWMELRREWAYATIETTISKVRHEESVMTHEYGIQ